MERTKQLDVSPDLAERMSPPPSAAAPAANGAGGRAAAPATTKWEPPAEFQARLAGLERAAAAERSSGVVPASSAREVPAAPASSPRASSVDATLDDASAEPPPAAPSGPSTIATPPPTLVEGPESGPRTLAGDAPKTQYTPPVPLATRQPSDPGPASSPDGMPERGRASRGLAFVLLCFVLGAAIAAGIAWKLGKLGGDGPEEERFVARATDAMYRNRWSDPPGDNVRDITDEGLRRWPGSRRLIDVRGRAADALVTRAQGHRASGDVAEALRVARLAQELDPQEAAARRLVEQYEGELGTFATPSAPPLGRPPPLSTANGRTPPNGAPPAAGYKVLIDVGPVRPGQPAELVARVAPPKGTFGEPTFTVTGPGAAGGARLTAESASPGVFKGSYVFAEPGKFEITFTTQADGRALKASRAVSAFAGGGPPVQPQTRPTQDPPQPTASPPIPTSPQPTTTASVKWM